MVSFVEKKFEILIKNFFLIWPQVYKNISCFYKVKKFYSLHWVLGTPFIRPNFFVHYVW